MYYNKNPQIKKLSIYIINREILQMKLYINSKRFPSFRKLICNV